MEGGTKEEAALRAARKDEDGGNRKKLRGLYTSKPQTRGSHTNTNKEKRKEPRKRLAAH